MNQRGNTWLFCLALAATCPTVLGWTAVGPGIEYNEYRLSDPNNVFVARMHRSDPACMIESSIGQGRLSGGTERMSSQANRYDDSLGYWGRDWGQRSDVIVAINGDFYNTSTGIPASGQIHSGWFAKHYIDNSFTWTLDRLAFVSSGINLRQHIVHLFSGADQVANGVNRARGADELIIYTSQFGIDTSTDASGVEVLVEMTRPALLLPATDPARGFVREIRQNLGSTPIPFDHIVLSATGTKATTLINNVSVGEQVAVSQGGTGIGGWAGAYAGVGGGEVFLRNGVVVGGQETRHPRTAIAFNDEYVFFVVVDGRSPDSVGMNMTELGSFCKGFLAAEWGINQDGGGSSTMVVNGIVKNDPSDGFERSVANGMMMIAVQPKVQSTIFHVNDLVRATSRASIRQGPGTNYPVLTTVANNAEGVVLNHHLRGVYAKGDYWWKCDFNGAAGWVAENHIILVSAGGLPNITQHPVERQVCEEAVATFAVVAAGTGTLTYQWQRNGIDLTNDGRYAGATSSVLNIADVVRDDMASYRCTVTDDVGTVSSYSAALLPPRAATMVTQQPESQDNPPALHGSDIAFTVGAAGDGVLSYRWQKDDNDLEDDGHFAGTTTSSLIIHHVSSHDNGSYRCCVSADCGTAYSIPALLKVVTPDFDGDGDVDQNDFGHLQACYSGPAIPQTASECFDARLDGDSDVDQSDFWLFQKCLAGANVAIDVHCLD